MTHLMRNALVAAMALGMGVSMVQADTVIHVARPGHVPDEAEPRVNVGDAPTGLGSDSWQGPDAGKTNWHARYLADGNVLSILFPSDAATLTIADIASISYWTKRPDGTPVSRDWWIQIYTRPDGNDDAAGWYGYRFLNNYNEHTETGDWTEYSTSGTMTFNRFDSKDNGNRPELTWSDLQSAYGTELIEMISIQTDSGWDGFDGYVDGLTITLTNGNVGIVNFEGSVVPLPAAAWAGLALLGGLGGTRVWRRRRTA